MIQLDQIVLNETQVIVRPEYATFAKDFWLYSEKWEEQDIVKGENLVMGGEYTIYKFNEDGVVYLQDKYARYDIPNTLGPEALELATNFMPCKFNVGDLVRPSSQFNYADFKSGLPSNYEQYFSERGSPIHRITGVLNKRYIFVDYEPLSDDSFPFPWDDFVLAE